MFDWLELSNAIYDRTSLMFQQRRSNMNTRNRWTLYYRHNILSFKWQSEFLKLVQVHSNRDSVGLHHWGWIGWLFWPSTSSTELSLFLFFCWSLALWPPLLLKLFLTNSLSIPTSLLIAFYLAMFYLTKIHIELIAVCKQWFSFMGVVHNIKAEDGGCYARGQPGRA